MLTWMVLPGDEPGADVADVEVADANATVSRLEPDPLEARELTKRSEHEQLFAW